MARQTYGIDWSDGAFPQIIRTEDMWDPDGSDRLTLAKAKQRIIDHFQSQADHARNMIRVTRAIRAADVLRTGEE
jgi:hypothetical protein